jgi:hypothetical protein
MMRKLTDLLICFGIIFILVTDLFCQHQFTKKFSGPVSDSDKEYFDLILSRIPHNWEEVKSMGSWYHFSQPNYHTVIELTVGEFNGLTFYCLLTDSSFMRKERFKKYYDENKLILRCTQLTVLSIFLQYIPISLSEETLKKNNISSLYIDYIFFYFFNTQNEYIKLSFVNNQFIIDLWNLCFPLVSIYYKACASSEILFNKFKTNALRDFLSHPFKVNTRTNRRANIREDAGMNSKIVCQIPGNSPVKLLTIYKKWFKIRFNYDGENRIGWIHSSCLEKQP